MSEEELLRIGYNGPASLRIIRQALRRHRGELHIAVRAGELRRGSRLTVEQVAERIGVDVATVERWERGEPISAEDANRLAALHGFSDAGWLLGEENR